MSFDKSAYNKDYYEKHKDKRDNTIKWECNICNITICRINKSRHENTMSHREKYQAQPSVQAKIKERQDKIEKQQQILCDIMRKLNIDTLSSIEIHFLKENINYFKELL
jgi:hypothetical protein